MRAKIENGILYLEPETDDEFESAYDWINKYDEVCNYNNDLISLIKINDTEEYDDSNLLNEDSIIENITNRIRNNDSICDECGNPEMQLNYNHVHEHIHIGCDVCGYAKQAILNNPKEVQQGENPKYTINEVKSSFILKTFFKEGYSTAYVDKKNIDELINKLENEKNELLLFFSVTYKDNKGHYKTQIFKNGNR